MLLFFHVRRRQYRAAVTRVSATSLHSGRKLCQKSLYNVTPQEEVSQCVGDDVKMAMRVSIVWSSLTLQISIATRCIHRIMKPQLPEPAKI